MSLVARFYDLLLGSNGTVCVRDSMDGEGEQRMGTVFSHVTTPTQYTLTFASEVIAYQMRLLKRVIGQKQLYDCVLLAHQGIHNMCGVSSKRFKHQKGKGQEDLYRIPYPIRLDPFPSPPTPSHNAASLLVHHPPPRSAPTRPQSRPSSPPVFARLHPASPLQHRDPSSSSRFPLRRYRTAA